MSRYSMLSVDLNRNVSSDARSTFNRELADRKWTKITSLTTVWYASWKDEVSDGGIIKTTKSDVAASAKAAEISNFDAAVSISTNKPTVW